VVCAGWLLAACTFVPDAVNPVRWYQSAIGIFEPEKESKSDELARKVPGAEDPFPKLALTPQPPARKTLLAEFEADRESLLAELADIRRSLDPLPAAPAAPPVPTLPDVPASPDNDELAPTAPMAGPVDGTPPLVAVLRFAPDGGGVSPGGHETLVKVAMLHRTRGGALRVFGVGASGLAHERATAVASELVSLGVARDALVVAAVPGDGREPGLPAGAADVFLVF
jgi:hypothetical protein